MKSGKWMLVLILVAFAAPAVQAGDWGSLSRLSKTQKVKVRLKSGKVLEGSIQQFEPERLGLVLSTGLTPVKLKEITEPGPITVGKWQVGETVELTLNNSQVLSGTIQAMDRSNITLAEHKNAVPVMREDVVRVTKRSRGLMAAIGAAAGFSLLVLTWGSDEGDGPGISTAILPAGIGALIGGAVGYNKTLYKAEVNATPNQQAP